MKKKIISIALVAVLAGTVGYRIADNKANERIEKMKETHILEKRHMRSESIEKEENAYNLGYEDGRQDENDEMIDYIIEHYGTEEEQEEHYIKQLEESSKKDF